MIKEKKKKPKEKLEFIQDCSIDTPLVRHHANKENLRKAGKFFIKRLAELDFRHHFIFTEKFLSSYFCKIEHMKFNDENYLVVTNSAIDYFFKRVKL